MSVWEDIADALSERTGNDNGRSGRFSVVTADPLTLDQIDGDEVLEDGDDDVSLSDGFRQHVKNYPLRPGDVVVATEAGGVWTLGDVESDQDPEVTKNPPPSTEPLAIDEGGTGADNATDARAGLGIVTGGTSTQFGTLYTSASHSAGMSIAIPATTHKLGPGRGKIPAACVEATGELLDIDANFAANGDVVITFAATQAANTVRVTLIG